MVEEWRDIVIEQNGVVYDYTGLYQVSNYGRVRSLNYRGNGGVEVLKPALDKKGYKRVTLFKNKNRHILQVHRLVALMFIPNPDNLPCVNHKDETPGHDWVENLEWCTYEYNLNYGTRSEKASKSLKDREFSEETKHKMSENHADVRGEKNPRARKVICVETKQIFDTLKQAGEWCNISKENICQCCKGRQKTAGGYHWKYLEDYLKESN